MPQLVKGQRVTIYQRWLTREDREGTATLRRFIAPALDHGEWWTVRFDGDDSDVERCIATGRCIACGSFGAECDCNEAGE